MFPGNWRAYRPGRLLPLNTLSKPARKQGSADFLLLVQNGEIVESRLAPNHPQTGIPEASQLTAATDISSWTPSASTAGMFLVVSLACDHGNCKPILQTV